LPPPNSAAIPPAAPPPPLYLPKRRHLDRSERSADTPVSTNAGRTTIPPSPLRSTDPRFLVPADRWIHRLGKEIATLQIGNGGPILMTQVENEYGNFGADKAYMAHLKSTFEDSGFTASLLYSADNWRNIPKGDLPGLLAATNFGIGNHEGGMDALARERPNQPLFVSEYWPGWFDHWGHPHETRPVPPQLEDVSYILGRGAGINIYMFHGGTSFGFMAGSSWTNNQFLPDVTSYDYDAPLDESGRPTEKFFAYRKLLAQFTPCPTSSSLSHPEHSRSSQGSAQPETKAIEASSSSRPERSAVEPLPYSPPPNSRVPHPSQPHRDGWDEQSPANRSPTDSCLPPIPPTPPTIAIPIIRLANSTPLWQNLPKPIASDTPRPMEDLNQTYGYILYRTELPTSVTGDLTIPGLHDFAVIYLDGKRIGTLDRRAVRLGPDRRPIPLSLPMQISGPARLDILVADDGRINSTGMMRTESKGLTGPIILAGQALTGWQIFPLPMSTLPTHFTPDRLRVAVERGTGSIWSEHPPASPSPQRRDPNPFVDPVKGAQAPLFRHATFNLARTGDTFLDITHLGKGALWINGHPIGRFWNIGPQQTLYVPGPWLRKGANEIILFDLLPPASPSVVSGLDHPILNGPAIDTTTSKQE